MVFLDKNYIRQTVVILEPITKNSAKKSITIILIKITQTLTPKRNPLPIPQLPIPITPTYQLYLT